MQNDNFYNEILSQIKSSKDLIAKQKGIVSRLLKSDIINSLPDEQKKTLQKTQDMYNRSLQGKVSKDEVENLINKIINDLDKK